MPTFWSPTPNRNSPRPRRSSRRKCRQEFRRTSLGWLSQHQSLQRRDSVLIYFFGQLTAVLAVEQDMSRRQVTLARVRNNYRRLSLVRLRVDDSVADGEVRMAVHLLNMPIESTELVRQRMQRHDLVRRAVVLPPVVVDDENHVSDAARTGVHHSLPDLTLLQFAVTYQAIRIR